MIYQTTKHNTLEDLVFNRHNDLDSCDELQIISGYIGPSAAKRLSELPFQANVICGMYRVGALKKHEHPIYVGIQNNTHNVNILYSDMPIHTKLYLWKKENIILSALLGSANFSFSSLNSFRRELLTDVTDSYFNELSEYSNFVINNSILCTDINEQAIDLSSDTETKPILCSISK